MTNLHKCDLRWRKFEDFNLLTYSYIDLAFYLSGLLISVLKLLLPETLSLDILVSAITSAFQKKCHAETC